MKKAENTGSSRNTEQFGESNIDDKMIADNGKYGNQLSKSNGGHRISRLSQKI
jgi:hypothetical protein